MPCVSDLQIKPLSQMFLPMLVGAHSVGFFDGGCFTLAQAVHLAFPETTKTMVAISRDGRIHHGLVLAVEKNLYGDADGWHTLESFKRGFYDKEGVLIDSVVEVDFVSYADAPVVLYNDILLQIAAHIESGDNISFELPLESSDSIFIGCGAFDGGAATVESDFAAGCSGVYHGFADGIESMILAHFSAGVDVVSAEYCEGVLTAMESAASNYGGCHCDACCARPVPVGV